VGFFCKLSFEKVVLYHSYHDLCVHTAHAEYVERVFGTHRTTSPIPFFEQGIFIRMPNITLNENEMKRNLNEKAVQTCKEQLLFSRIQSK